MLAQFEIIGRVARITPVNNQNTRTREFVTVVSDADYQKAGEWVKKPVYHTLTIKEGLEKVSRGLSVGDLVRFTGEINSWQTKVEGTNDFRQGVDLVPTHRRIIVRKRSDGSEEIGAPDHVPADLDDEVPY